MLRKKAYRSRLPRTRFRPAVSPTFACSPLQSHLWSKNNKFLAFYKVSKLEKKAFYKAQLMKFYFTTQHQI
jgi:hypothetical protein